MARVIGWALALSFGLAGASARAVTNQRMQVMRSDGATEAGVASSPWVVSGTAPGGSLPLYEASDTAFNSCRVFVGTTAVALRCGSSNQSARRIMYIFNNGGSAIYIGSTTGVTTNSGFPLPAPSGGLLSATGYIFTMFQVGPDVTIYAVAGSTGNDVRIIEGS